MLLEKLNDEVLNAFEGICYTVDREGRILNVGGDNWDRFAEATGKTAPDAAGIKQRNLFDCIAGEAVRAQVREVMDELAAGKADRWIMPLRCDGPETKRTIRLSIRPVGERGSVDGFLYQSVTLDESERPPLDIFDFEAIRKRLEEDRALPLVTLCSYCQRVKDEVHTRGQWISAERYYARGGSSEVRLSHGICPPCYGNIRSSLDND